MNGLNCMKLISKTAGKKVKIKTSKKDNMKKLFLLLSIFIATQSFAQDTTKVKMKEWLGVLTLAEKYKTPANWDTEAEKIGMEHYQRLLKMKNEGMVVLAGRMQIPINDPNMMGLVIFYAKDEQEATDFIMNDPAVKNKIMQAKIYPYAIAVSSCK
jgi:uncharacterized protein